MLNNLTSEIERVKSKPTVDKYRQQIEALLHQIQEEINDLHGDFVTQNLTTDSALVNGQVTAHSAEIDQALIDLIQTRHAILEYLESDNAELTDAVITRLNAPSITSESIVTEDLDVRGNLQLNTISATTANASNATVANKLTAGEIEAGDIKAEDVTADSLTTDKVTTGDIETGTAEITTADVDSATVDNLTTGIANITRLTAGVSTLENVENINLTSHFIRNSYNRSIGTINCDPSRQTVNNWYAFTIPERVHNYTLYLHSKYTNLDQNEYEWSTTIVGNDTCAIITYTEDSTTCIKDFSFDRDSGRFRIRFFADDTVDFKFDYLADEPIELDVEYNKDALLDIHEPIKNKGYIFQSYNDDTVEFYFGGAVFVHSLGAEFQEFEKQETKQLYVERNVFLPDIVNDDRSVATWDVGREGSYITNRDDGYGNLITKWEDPVDEIKHVDKFVTSDTIANYDGTVDVTVDPSDPQYEYPIVNLGDGTLVHGTFKSNHIYDGDAATLPSTLPDGSIVVLDSTDTYNEVTINDVSDYDPNIQYYNNTHQPITVTYDEVNDTWEIDGVIVNTPFQVWTKETIKSKPTRKRTDPNTTNAVYDEIAAYDSRADYTLANGNVMVYDKPTNTIKPAKDINLGNVVMDHLLVNENAHIKGDLYVDGVMHTVEEETITSSSDKIILRANNDTSLGNDTSGIIINNYDGNDHSLELSTSSDGTLKVGTGELTIYTYSDIYQSLANDKWYTDEELTVEVEPEGYLKAWSNVEKTDTYVHYEDAEFAKLHNSTLEPIMTRDEDVNLDDNALLRWDRDDTEAKTIALPQHEEDFLTAHLIPGTSVEHNVITDGTNFYNVASPITTTTEPEGTAGTPTSLGQTTRYNGNYYKLNALGNEWHEVLGFVTIAGTTLYDMGPAVTDSDLIDALNTSTDFVTFSLVVYTEEVVPNKWTYEWKNKAAGLYVFATMQDYDQYELDHPGEIQLNSQIIIENDTNYLKTEDIE